MKSQPPLMPKLIQDNLGENCLHIFFIHNPVAVIMSTMIAEAFNIPPHMAYAVSIRHTKTDMTGFGLLSTTQRGYDRYINRLTGRNLAAIRLRRKLANSATKYIVYASWVYPEVEELISSRQCAGHIIFEEGQQSYYRSKPYSKTYRNSWLFRRKKILNGSINHYFREGSSGYIGMSPQAFPLISPSQRFVLSNIPDVAKRYTPCLTGIKSIGLMPAPRRLAYSDVFPAIDGLMVVMEGAGVIKMHPGFLSERAYNPVDYSKYIESRSGGRIKLCPDDVVIELEMLSERKMLYGARTSLSRYAEVFGSSFHLVEFDNYIHPII